MAPSRRAIWAVSKPSIAVNGYRATTAAVAVGASVESDAIPLAIDPLSDVAVSIYFPAPTGQATCHQSAFQDNYVAAGDVSSSASLSGVENKGSYFILTNLDVQNPAAL